MVYIPKNGINIDINFCNKLDIKILEGNYILINLETNEIILNNENESCIFCQSLFNLTKYKKYYICNDCLNNIKEIDEETYYY